MNKRRVVITGLGAVTPLGLNVADNWRRITAGESGIGAVTQFDASGFPSTIAGEVRGFDTSTFLSEKEARKMDRFIQLGMAAGVEAVKDAGIIVTDANAERIGCYIGSGIGGVHTIEETTRQYLEKGARRISPFYIPMSIINMISGNLSILYGFKGPNLSIVTACATSTHAIGEAGRIVEYGDADIMVAGGAEASVTPTSMAGFGNARALSSRNDDPTRASRPWDRDRDGFVLSEGGAVVVLEELEHARARGARIYAELLGFGMSGDAYHLAHVALYPPRCVRLHVHSHADQIAERFSPLGFLFRTSRFALHFLVDFSGPLTAYRQTPLLDHTNVLRAALQRVQLDLRG